MHGNPGDRMIDRAACQMFERFGVDYRNVDWVEVHNGALERDVDEIVVSGGGNMGRTYEQAHDTRQKALALDRPVSVLPQSFIDAEEDVSGYRLVFVRERASLQLDPRFRLAPDLALGVEVPACQRGPRFETGLFLREDVESRLAPNPLSLGDPAVLCDTVEDYLELAGEFAHVLTDRLHFAIAGLLMGRGATLLPNSYDKNQAVYECWLAELSCGWRNNLDGLDYDHASVERELFQRLAGSPSRLLPWSARPVRVDGYRIDRRDTEHFIVGPDGRRLARCNAAGALIWELCDGQDSVAVLANSLMREFSASPALLARDLQRTLRDFFERGAIAFDSPCPAPQRRAGDRLSRQRVAGSGVQRVAGNREGGPVEVYVREPKTVDGRLRWEAVVAVPGEARTELYYETDPRHRGALMERADPFALAALNHAMRAGRTMWIRGAPVSFTLLRNLEEYQRAWASWRPELRTVPLFADEVADTTSERDPAILGFSGGIDSCFSVYRHSVARHGRRDRLLEACLMVQGFDIPVSDRHGFAAAFARSQRLLEGTNLELIELETNVRCLHPHWGECSHGLALASALTLFGARFGSGIIASSVPYRMLFPWGTNPVTDWLMGSADFEIFHDGADAPRLRKVEALLNWPNARDHARFCWQGLAADRNCGRCPKCVITALMFKSLGAEPACFDQPVSDDVINSVLGARPLTRLERFDLSMVVQEARARGTSGSWATAVEVLVR